MSAELRRVLAGVAVAAVVGAWTFAGTRASMEDIETLRREIEKVEREARTRGNSLAEKIEAIRETIQDEAVAAASFRAQVRSALEIKQPDGY